MLRKIPFPQLLDWMAYDQLDPIGGRRGDWQAAAVSATVANMVARSVGSKKVYKVEDFLLRFDAEQEQVEKRQQTWQEQKMIAKMFVAAYQPEKKRKRG